MYHFYDAKCYVKTFKIQRHWEKNGKLRHSLREKKLFSISTFRLFLRMEKFSGSCNHTSILTIFVDFVALWSIVDVTQICNWVLGQEIEEQISMGWSCKGPVIYVTDKRHEQDLAWLNFCSPFEVDNFFCQHTQTFRDMFTCLTLFTHQ